MKNFSLLLCIIFLFFGIRLFAINPESLKKYSNPLISNDYGILNEANLKRYTDDIISEPFNWKITGFDYWQCFQTKKVFVWYERGDYDSDEKITRGHPHITIEIHPTEIHDYVIRRGFSIEYAKEQVAIWKRLIKNQQYVCVGGAFAGTHEIVKNGKKIIEHGWIFENLKTKKGCDSYFSGWCD